MGPAAWKSFIKLHADCHGTDRKMQLRAAIKKTPKDFLENDQGGSQQAPWQTCKENSERGPGRGWKCLRWAGPEALGWELLEALQLHAVRMWAGGKAQVRMNSGPPRYGQVLTSIRSPWFYLHFNCMPSALILATMSLRNVPNHEVMSFQIQCHWSVPAGSQSPFLPRTDSAQEWAAMEPWGVHTGPLHGRHQAALH